MASPPSTRRLILYLIVITSFINPFLGAAINIALPSINEEFRMGAVGMSWVAMGFLLSSAVFLVPLGKIADIHGRMRKVKHLTSQVPLFTFCPCRLLCSACPSFLKPKPFY